MPDLSGMSDDMLQAQINMMKSNPDMIKNMMRAQGMNMDDSQLDMITNMMTPEMMRYAQTMQKSGMAPPGGFGNTATTANPATATGSETATGGFPGMGGFPNMAGGDPDAMKNMTNQLLSDPAMLRNMMKMMSSDPNSPMMAMIRQQFPNMNPNTLSWIMSIMGNLLIGYSYVRTVWSYTVTKILFFCL